MVNTTSTLYYLNATNQILAATQIQANRCGQAAEAKQNPDNREGKTAAFGQSLRAGFQKGASVEWLHRAIVVVVDGLKGRHLRVRQLNRGAHNKPLQKLGVNSAES